VRRFAVPGQDGGTHGIGLAGQRGAVRVVQVHQTEDAIEGDHRVFGDRHGLVGRATRNDRPPRSTCTPGNCERPNTMMSWYRARFCSGESIRSVPE